MDIQRTLLALKSDEQRCLQAGADEYLSKPVKLKHWVTPIEALLERSNIQV